MVQRAKPPPTPAPAVDKNNHPLHVLGVPSRLVRWGHVVCPCSPPHNWLGKQSYYYILPDRGLRPCAPSMRRPAARLTTFPVMSDADDYDLEESVSSRLLLAYYYELLSSMIRIELVPFLSCARIRRASNYTTIILTDGYIIN